MLPWLLALALAGGFGVKKLCNTMSAEVNAPYPLEALVPFPAQVTDRQALIAHYKQSFSKQVIALEQEICREAGIDEQWWRELAFNCNQNVLEDRARNKRSVKEYHASKAYQELDRRVVRVIEQTLTAFGIDPEEIRVVAHPDTSAAGVKGCTIGINHNLLRSLPDQLIKFIIAHEIQHILFDDSISMDALLLTSKSKYSPHRPERMIKPNKLDLLYTRRKKTIEARADVLAALHANDLTIGFNLWARRNQPMLLDISDDHPTQGQRLVLSTLLLQQVSRFEMEMVRYISDSSRIDRCKKALTHGYDYVRQRCCGARSANVI